MARIVILGAGISGLALGYYLKEKFKDKITLTLLEKEDQVGGVMRFGPRTLRSHTELIEKLHIQDQIVEASQVAKKRYILAKGKLRAVPSLYFLKEILIGVYKDLTCKKAVQEEESIATFSERHFGLKFTEQFVDPFVKGIFAGNIHELSMRANFPFLVELEKKGRPLLLSKRKKITPYSFKGGMNALPIALAKTLQSSLCLGKKVHALSFQEKEVNVTLEDGEVVQADYLFSTLPADILYHLGVPIDELLEIPYKEIEVITLNCGNEKLRYQGFGYLVPQKEEEKVLGVIFDSLVFPRQETILTVIANEGADALFAVKKHLNLKNEPKVTSRHTLRLPQYTLNYLNRLQVIDSKKDKRLFLLGNAFRGISVNECILNAKNMAENFSFNL